MALVDYASSNDADEDVLSKSTRAVSAFQSLKRKRVLREERVAELPPLPPLPSKFYDLYASTTRVSTTDDPSLHGGRKRAMPHVEGVWPTHLYVEWYPSITEYSSLNGLISNLKVSTPLDAVNHKITSFLTSDLGAPLPLHISLSRPISLSTDQKDDFVASLERAISSSAIRPFDVVFAGLDWVSNFENTRWFLVLRLQKPVLNGLNKLLHTSNTIVQECGQPSLYTESSITDNHTPKFNATFRNQVGKKKPGTTTTASPWKDMQDLSSAFHFSIAWTLTTPSQELLESTRSVMHDHFDEIKQIRVAVEKIKAKVGNGVTSMPLPKSVTIGKGLFGS